MTTMEKFDMLAQLAARLTTSENPEERYFILLEAFYQLVGGDAVALLRMDGGMLSIVACLGLSPDAMGRCFDPREHPRLDMICNSKEPVVFSSDCDLPDPYNGLIACDESAAANIHSCMGLPLTVNRRLIGVLTADALSPDVFVNLDMPLIKALSVYAGAEIQTTRLIKELENTQKKMCQVSRHLVQDARQFAGGELLGTSEVIRRLRREIRLIAGSEFSVLITGETGAGKEVAAREIHATSRRCDHPLLYLNCAALPQTLVESELFGHVRGAFTGATAEQPGKLEVADGATLFLDEIGELPLEVQPKLLRFLQTGEVQRVGSNRSRTLNVRLLAATNRNLAAAMKEGRFRSDLYHRLNVYPLNVPPLREHPEDIPVIAGRLCEVIQRQLGIGPVRFRPDSLRALASYKWPGNVRELENVVARAILRASADQDAEYMIIVAPHHLSSDLSSTENTSAHRNGMADAIASSRRSLKAAVEDFQRDLIRAAVEKNAGNWAAAARELGVNRSNLHKLAKRLAIKNTLDQDANLKP